MTISGFHQFWSYIVDAARSPLSHLCWAICLVWFQSDFGLGLPVQLTVVRVHWLCLRFDLVWGVSLLRLLRGHPKFPAIPVWSASTLEDGLSRDDHKALWQGRCLCPDLVYFCGIRGLWKHFLCLSYLFWGLCFPPICASQIWLPPQLYRCFVDSMQRISLSWFPIFKELCECLRVERWSNVWCQFLWDAKRWEPSK